MEILKKIDWKILETYIENNLIIANKHPEYDIWILNYTPKVQSKKLWDDYTISARGLVIDSFGNIVSRPFRKFKNFEEHEPSDFNELVISEITEKMDGSMISIFYYFGEWIVASRGSFLSEQSIGAKKLIKSFQLDILDIGNTYIFEYIAPDNRIVVNYGNMSDLVMLGVINTSLGLELSIDEIKKIYSKYFTIVKKHDIKVSTLSDLKKLEEDNREGFVIKFNNGLRVKVKFDEYVRLHGILTNVSNLTVWENLMNNYNFDLLLDRIPDEFYSWLNRTANNLQNEYYAIERLALIEFVRIYHINDIKERREFAFEANKTPHRSILFKLFDKKPYALIIWQMIRPKYSKPFKDGYLK